MHKNQGNPKVRCVVNTCKYYGTGDYCTAKTINIEPRNASNCEMTDCATFERK